MDVHLESVSAEAFKPFGELLDRPQSPPRQDFAASLQNLRPRARPNMALIRSDPFAFQPVKLMERHENSNQLFVPLDVSGYLVLVAKGGEQPDLKTLRGFRVGANQAINYFTGTWHIGMATLDRPGVFVMFIHADGGPDDCHFCKVAPIMVSRN